MVVGACASRIPPANAPSEGPRACAPGQARDIRHPARGVRLPDSAREHLVSVRAAQRRHDREAGLCPAAGPGAPGGSRGKAPRPGANSPANTTTRNSGRSSPVTPATPDKRGRLQPPASGSCRSSTSRRAGRNCSAWIRAVSAPVLPSTDAATRRRPSRTPGTVAARPEHAPRLHARLRDGTLMRSRRE